MTRPEHRRHDDAHSKCHAAGLLWRPHQPALLCLESEEVDAGRGDDCKKKGWEHREKIQKDRGKLLQDPQLRFDEFPQCKEDSLLLLLLLLLHPRRRVSARTALQRNESGEDVEEEKMYRVYLHQGEAARRSAPFLLFPSVPVVLVELLSSGIDEGPDAHPGIVEENLLLRPSLLPLLPLLFLPFQLLVTEELSYHP